MTLVRAGSAGPLVLRGPLFIPGPLRGVTYGTFAPNAAGELFPAPDVARGDLDGMVAAGFGAVRAYTPPPRWLLDLAHERGLHVLVGLPWEQHVAFPDARDLRQRLRRAVRDTRHPAVMAYAIGNEIPAPLVRWHGPARTAALLRTLADVVRQEDPRPVTYASYPTTEYLELPFLDFLTFNVFLERGLDEYLPRLHHLANGRPVVLGEIGLDSRAHGEQRQADVIRTQVRQAEEAGCAATFVFSWTDEWHRGGEEVTGWEFGLVDRQRRPKRALRALPEPPAEPAWPRLSVVICTHNGARTLERTLQETCALRYPDLEVLVVDDGSTDATPAIAQRHPVRYLRIPHQGLAHARNVGWQAATGEVVAYLDDDAWPDPEWPFALTRELRKGGWAGVGGPNLPPQDENAVARAVARAPGGPTHVMLTDREAEHLPGCNMAFRREALARAGGFDPLFRAAGDDVDIGWRIQATGGRLGFAPTAVVWHRRRDTIRGFWRQQVGYGRAEALLESRWPSRYSADGHPLWEGQVYPARAGAIYTGTWGSAGFQRVYGGAAGPCGWLMLPEWWLALGALMAVGAAGAAWRPLLLAWVLAAALAAAPLASALATRHPLVALLHLLQPTARLLGRLRATPRPQGWTWPQKRVVRHWSETWRDPADRLRAAQERLAPVAVGGPFDFGWDLSVRGGLFGGARVLLAVEEHGQGRQGVLWRVTPWTWAGPAVGVLLALTAAAALDGATTAATATAALALGTATLVLRDCGRAVAACLRALPEW